MYAQKYLMALKQNIAHTLKSYGYILSYVLQPAPIVKIWDGEMRIEMLHRNKKLCNLAVPLIYLLKLNVIKVFFVS